jgi:dTDP-4-dehydrorhamnose 3,5-epimerase
MDVIDLPLAGLKLIKPAVFRDPRGFFIETYNRQRYLEAGIDCDFVQDNQSQSTRGTLRGLHYQSKPGQAKLVRCSRGRVFDVALDIRPTSPTFGQWHGVELADDDHAQLFVPVGFAHGYCVLSDVAEFQYKVSSPYDPAVECGLRWNDPAIGVAWPVSEPILSKRDQATESFADFVARVKAP